MDFVYSLLDRTFPFELLGYSFMKNAFLAILLVTPLFGLLSTMVVSNRMAFLPILWDMALFQALR